VDNMDFRIAPAGEFTGEKISKFSQEAVQSSSCKSTNLLLPRGDGARHLGRN